MLFPELALIAALLISVIDTASAEGVLIKGNAYKVPETAICNNIDAIYELRDIRDLGDFVTFPPGCGVSEVELFVPEFVVPNLIVIRKLIKFSPQGGSNCTDNTTGQTNRCDVWYAPSRFIKGVALRKKDNQYVEMFVQANPDTTVEDAP